MIFGDFANYGFHGLHGVRPGTAIPLSLSSCSEATLHDHACGDGLVGAWIDEDEGTGEAVAAVGVVEEGCGSSQ